MFYPPSTAPSLPGLRQPLLRQQAGGAPGGWGASTVAFHNFKSRNFKLSVSNPKSKYVAYLSVLSQISNCQGLGHKNKHDILKTDRSIIIIVEVLIHVHAYQTFIIISNYNMN